MSASSQNIALPVWPKVLPTHVRRPSYRASPITNVVRFQPDSGDPIALPRTTSRMERLSVTYRMNDVQLTAFKNFVWEELAQATAWFQATHPASRTIGRAKIVSDPPFEERRISNLMTDVSMEVLWRGGLG